MYADNRSFRIIRVADSHKMGLTGFEPAIWALSALALPLGYNPWWNTGVTTLRA